MKIFSSIDRSLQRELQKPISLSNSFGYNGTQVSYSIKSNEGLIFDDKQLNKIHTANFISSNNKKIFYQHWIQDPSQPTIFFIHGNAENSSTHPLFIYNLLKQGYNFFAFDQEGHGDSQGIRGTFSSFNKYILHTANLYTLCLQELEKKSHPKLEPNINIIGFSVGGLVALYFLLFNKQHNDGNNPRLKHIKKAILLAPYLRNNKRLISPFVEFIQRFFPFNHPKTRIIRQESQLNILKNDSNFYVEIYKNLSDNKAFLSRRWSDKRIHRLNSLYWISNMIRAQYKVFKKAKQKPKLLPELYFFVNSLDSVVDNNRTSHIATLLGYENNLFIQENYFHEFLDYEDNRGKTFYTNLNKILK